MMFLPFTTALTSAAIVWSYVYTDVYAVIFNTMSPLGQSNQVVVGIAAIAIWRDMGYCMLIYIAGLKAIPDDYYEAATIDGASVFQRFFKITLPLLLLLDRADAARRDELLALLARCREDEAAVDALQQAVEEQGGLQEASKVMQSYLQRATALLAEWPDGPIRSALVNLCAYVAERNR